MNSYTPKSEFKMHLNTDNTRSIQTAQLKDNRTAQLKQVNTQQFVDNSPKVVQQKEKGAAISNTPVQRMENKTGLPDQLKSGIESLSGMDMSDTRVHYNSSAPAQLQAHAFAQGNNIHIAPGQEQHLAHEAWHVVQQKQGRVKATKQLKGKTPVNDDAGLEREADIMGAKAMQMKSDGTTQELSSSGNSSLQGNQPVQRIKSAKRYGIKYSTPLTDSGLVMVGILPNSPVIQGLGRLIDQYRVEKDGILMTLRMHKIGNLDELGHSDREHFLNKLINLLDAMNAYIDQHHLDADDAEFDISDIYQDIEEERNYLNEEGKLRLKKTPPRKKLKNYKGNTVGVEQEIQSEQKIRILDNSQGTQGYVEKHGVRLVEYTSDMLTQVAHEYTIELKTTPSEKDSEVAIADRLKAMSIMLDAIIEAGKERRGVRNKKVGDFNIVIVRPNNIVTNGAIDQSGINFSNQASLGVQTQSLVGNSPEVQLIRSKARWYYPTVLPRKFQKKLDNPEAAQEVYNLISCAIRFLANIIEKESELVHLNKSNPKDLSIKGDLYNSGLKDSWGVLPRTPIWDWLNFLSSSDQNQVSAAIMKMSPAGVSQRSLDAARDHIKKRKPLAGHKVPESTIWGEQASVFEFRRVPDELDRYTYHTPIQEAESHSPDMLQHIKTMPSIRARMTMEQENDADSEDDTTDWLDE